MAFTVESFVGVAQLSTLGDTEHRVFMRARKINKPLVRTLGIVGLLVFYILSAGPAIYGLDYCGEWFNNVLGVIYFPTIPIQNHSQIYLEYLTRWYCLANGLDRSSLIARTKDELLHNQDSRALLTAFREVIRTRKSFSRDTRWRVMEGDEEAAAATEAYDLFIKPNDAKLPLVIRDLHPVSIRCLYSRLDIIFIGEKGREMALVAGAPDFIPEAEWEKVIDGLWFYEIERPTPKKLP
jgi:hypothetical protein